MQLEHLTLLGRPEIDPARAAKWSDELECNGDVVGTDAAEHWREGLGLFPMMAASREAVKASNKVKSAACKTIHNTTVVLHEAFN